MDSIKQNNLRDAEVDRLIISLKYRTAFTEAEDAPKRSAAAERLGNLGDPRAVEPLIASLLRRGDIRSMLLDEPVHKAIAVALGKLKDSRAIEPLFTAMQNPAYMPSATCSFIDAILSFNDPRTASQLIGLLTHKRSEVRGYAAKAIGNLGDKSVVQPLIAALQDKDVFVRARVAEALQKLDSSEETGLLIASVLEKISMSSEKCRFCDATIKINSSSCPNCRKILIRRVDYVTGGLVSLLMIFWGLLAYVSSMHPTEEDMNIGLGLGIFIATIFGFGLSTLVFATISRHSGVKKFGLIFGIPAFLITLYLIFTYKEETKLAFQVFGTGISAMLYAIGVLLALEFAGRMFGFRSNYK